MDPIQLDTLRRLVFATLAELGVECDAAGVSETALHSAAAIAGRRFQYQSVRAVWFADRQSIDFFTDDGRLLRSVPLPAVEQPVEHAA